MILVLECGLPLLHVRSAYGTAREKGINLNMV